MIQDSSWDCQLLKAGIKQVVIMQLQLNNSYWIKYTLKRKLSVLSLLQFQNIPVAAQKVDEHQKSLQN